MTHPTRTTLLGAPPSTTRGAFPDPLPSLDAVCIGPRRWMVRPKGRLGACGELLDGRLWQMIVVTASDAEQAVRRATPRFLRDMESQL